MTVIALNNDANVPLILVIQTLRMIPVILSGPPGKADSRTWRRTNRCDNNRGPHSGCLQTSAFSASSMFMKIITGIASTTHVDAHNERFTKRALDDMAERIRSRFIPFLINHDPNRQIGIILHGQVEPTVDGEFALLIVAGMFDGSEEDSVFLNGAHNFAWRDYKHFIQDLSEDDSVQSISDGNRIQEGVAGEHVSIADLLETHLDSTSVWIDGRVIRVKHLIASTGDLFIHVYRDHDPPHFHVISKQRNINARFNLDTLDPLKGSISPNDVKKIKDFFRLRPEVLKKLRYEHARMQQ